MYVYALESACPQHCTINQFCFLSFQTLSSLCLFIAYYLVLACPKLDDNPAPRGICFLFPCSFYCSRILMFIAIFEIFIQSLLRAPANIRMTTQKGMWQMTECYYWAGPNWARGQLLVLSQWLSYVPTVSRELLLISNHIHEKSGGECLPALP